MAMYFVRQSGEQLEAMMLADGKREEGFESSPRLQSVMSFCAEGAEGKQK